MRDVNVRTFRQHRKVITRDLQRLVSGPTVNIIGGHRPGSHAGDGNGTKRTGLAEWLLTGRMSALETPTPSRLGIF